MNDIVFFITLIVLTIAHVIGDFRTPYRTFDRTSWKTMLLSEYVLVLNPMHGLWDAYSPFRRHPQYLIPIDKILVFKEWITRNVKKATAPKGVHAPSWHAQNSLFMITDRRFWVWLGIDQAYHMFSNILVAWLLAVLI
jgi:hypothetical protein